MRKLNDSVLLSLALIRSIGAAVNHIDDCDEVFNYWEPLHYLVYGSGMQTWEYAPDYALRTYAYLTPFALVGKFLSFCGVDKLGTFFAIRMALALLSAGFETLFVQSIQQRFGKDVGDYTYWFLLFSPGCFICATALLPSSFCWYCVLAGYSAWFMGKPLLTVLAGSVAVFWSGWPFVGVIFLPMGLVILAEIYCNKGVKAAAHFVIKAVGVVVCTMVPAVAIDLVFYKRLTLPWMNIMLYNALAGAGDELYGVAPVSYYLKNLVLNMNIAWLLACVLPFLIVHQRLRFSRSVVDAIFACLPAVIWLCITFSRPHKEERFLYPVYSIIALMAGFSLQYLCDALSDLVENKIHSLTNGSVTRAQVLKVARQWLAGVFFVVAMLLGMSRIVSHYTNYAGYMGLWKNFSNSEFGAERTPTTNSINVCMGNDWYTYPSSFFLPARDVKLQFVKSEFTGQLPQHFLEHNGTFAPPNQPFNTLNLEEPSRYVPIEQCHYVITTIHDPPRTDLAQQLSRDLKRWENVASSPVIDPDHSPSLTRAFFIPEWSHMQNSYSQYALFKQQNL